MGKKQQAARREAERRSFEESRAIDVSDDHALRFWSKRLGVPAEEIAEVVKEVGTNPTAVALKLEAPFEERIVPPTFTPR